MKRERRPQRSTEGIDPCSPIASVACIEAFTDDELTIQALEADPESVPADDAVSFWALSAPSGALQLLPDWYMPTAMAGTGSRWRRRVAIAIIVAFVLIYAYGLCSTYGHVELA